MLRNALIFSILLTAASSASFSATLGITDDGRNFTIDRKPVFFYGISYYGADSIATPSFLTDDLDDMVKDGINWVRVWAYWKVDEENVSVTDRDGNIREPYMSRLKNVISESNKRDIIIDVTLGRGDDPFPGNQEQHLACIKTIASELLPYRNVYIDIGNERDIRDARYVSYEDMGALISAAKQIDPERLCTASGVPNSKDDMRKYLETGHCDFICPHLGRERGSSSKTIARVNQLIGWMKELGVRVPVHLQEPFRRGYGNYQPVSDDFVRDASGAKIAGAAGWCLHNGTEQSSKDQRPFRSFLMNNTEGRLYKQLDSDESDALTKLYSAIGGTDVSVTRYQAEYEEQVNYKTGRSDGDKWSASPGHDRAGSISFVEEDFSGKHSVIWRLMIPDGITGKNAIASLEAKDGDRLIAQRILYARSFRTPNEWQDIRLLIPGNHKGDIQFSLFWKGNTDMSCDYVTVK